MVPRTRSKNAPSIDFVGWLDSPLFVEKGLAGRYYKVSIAGRSAVLTLPLEGSGPPAEPSSQPVRPIPSFPPPRLREPPSIGGPSTIESLGTPEGTLLVGAVRIRYEAAFEFETVMPFVPGVRRWLSVARNWLAGWSDAWGEQIEPKSSAAVRLALHHDPEAGPFVTTGGRPSVWRKMTVFPTNEVEGAFAAASLGIDLPLEHQLLRDARCHHYQRDYRHAVINACTAAEVALSQAAPPALTRAGWSNADIKRAVGTNGVANLYRLFALRGEALPVPFGQVVKKLASPRNRAAHEGVSLDANVSREAITTAGKLLELTPLPRPGSLRRKWRESKREESTPP